MSAPRTRWARRVPADPRLRRALAAYALGILVEFATWLAILLVAYEANGAVGVGTASVAMLVPAIVLVPFLAMVGDRLPRGRAVSLAYAAVAATCLLTGALMWAEAPLWAVLAAGAALSVGVSVARPLHFALLPLLAHRPGDLIAANSLSTALEGITVFAGFAAAGVITNSVGAWVVLVGAAVLSLAAALLTRGLGVPRYAWSDRDPVGDLRAAVQGFLSLRGQSGAVALLLLIAMVAALEGADDTLTVTWNDQVLGNGADTAGLLAGAYGLGLALGAGAQVALTHRRRLAPMVLAGVLGIAVCEASVVLLGALAPAVIALTLVGVGLSMLTVSSRTLLQRGTDNAVLARVLAIEEVVRLTGLAIGAAIAPVLVHAVGPRAAFVPIPLVVLTFALLSFPAITRLDRRATIRPRELALLAQVPFLSPLAADEAEHLAQGAMWRTAAAGSRVVTQGEQADSFYIVATGRLSVAVDGRLRDHELGPGDGFGEIALLQASPRTATVTAVSDSELLVLRREVFLAALTSSGDGMALAQQVSEARLAADRDRA